MILTLTIICYDKWIYNLSTCTIPNNVINTLAFGSKFSYSSEINVNNTVESIVEWNAEQLLYRYE